MMTSKRSSIAILGGFLAVICAAVPYQLSAQAPPAPLAPSPSPDTRPSPPPPPLRRAPPPEPQEKVAPRQNISGSWKFNRDSSDDARQKIERAQHRGRDTRTGPTGGNGPMGGGYPYPYPGGNPNGPYGGGPYGGPGNGPYGGNSGDDENDRETQLPEMREYIFPPAAVTFALKDSEVDLADDRSEE